MTTADKEDLPARTEDYENLPVAERIEHSADALEEFNRLLWQIARTVYIIAGILFAIFMVFAMYMLAEFAVGVA